jgi:hypothetical protein
MRVFALSDIHVDYSQNMAWIRDLSHRDYLQDLLLLAGDACHEIGKLSAALECLRKKFAQVFFVPGNHELWLLGSDCSHSLQKFHRVLEACQAVDVQTKPARFDDGHDGLWIVPLFSWYVKPEEGPTSLFLPKEEPCGDEMLDAWADERLVQWPGTGPAAQYFHNFNLPYVDAAYDAPVISFSHFLPRGDLLFPPHLAGTRAAAYWPFNTGFNFSRVAGTWALDQEVRKLGSRIHAYGHQHRNRSVLIDGVFYVSHCLGYPHERKSGRIGFFESGPRLIWEHGRPAVSS